MDPDLLNLNVDQDPGFLLILDPDQAVAESGSDPDPEKVQNFHAKIYF
jgi:hypothetical protein